MHVIASLVLLLVASLAPVTAAAQSAPRSPSTQKWVVAWAGAVQGPYPIGNPSAQPDLSVAFPSEMTGARDQSFRMVLKPEIARRACASRTRSARNR